MKVSSTPCTCLAASGPVLDRPEGQRLACGGAVGSREQSLRSMRSLLGDDGTARSLTAARRLQVD
jgi:hypothetical protein